MHTFANHEIKRPGPKPRPKPETKVCPCCGEEFPFTTEYFWRNRAFRHGLGVYCKACNHTKNKEKDKQPDGAPYYALLEMMSIFRTAVSATCKIKRKDYGGQVWVMKVLLGFASKEGINIDDMLKCMLKTGAI